MSWWSRGRRRQPEYITVAVFRVSSSLVLEMAVYPQVAFVVVVVFYVHSFFVSTSLLRQLLYVALLSLSDR